MSSRACASSLRGRCGCVHARVRRRAAPKQLDVVFDNVEVSELMHLRYEVEAALTDLQPQARE